MRRTLMRDPVFWLCLFLLTVLLILSFGNTILRDGQVDKISNRYAEDGTFLATSPLKPSSDQWLGTDRSGNDLFQLMIEGFKWTVGICILVALSRMFLSLVIAIPLAFRTARVNRYLKLILDGFLVLPLSLVSLLLLFSSLVFIDSTVVPSLFDRVSFELIILILLGLPSLSLYLIAETRQLLSQEFMIVAQTLGGSPWHRFRRHILPHLIPTLMIVFMQQFIQTLMLLIHLSLLGIFFAGTVNLYEGVMPTIFEWSSMFGYYYNQFSATSWLNHMFLVPLIGLALIVFFSNLFMSRLERAFRFRQQLKPIKGSASRAQDEAAATSMVDPFTLVARNSRHDSD
ncbi:MULTISPECIES: ABC transporter permease subunit [unclassified Exiguobacterium]|uniref:ABC transporter permease subunit n=1 Tax=unclassified Exiguobacterium TaxID=2644629 RepID=UPI0025B94423|nr:MULTISPECIES: ABC transporter permease subunit [unclassified Exiguobacterium]